MLPHIEILKVYADISKTIYEGRSNTWIKIKNFDYQA